MQHAQDEPVLAAAAEEMSGQVQDLQQLIGFTRFRGDATDLAKERPC
jgi:hypothetical protein